jgi:hypothetical protein
MKTLKSKLTRPVCLILSVIFLSGALAVTALTGSPYSTAKDAALNLAFAEQYQLEYDLTATIGGVTEGSSHGLIQQGRDSSYSNTDGNYNYQTPDFSVNGTIGDFGTVYPKTFENYNGNSSTMIGEIFGGSELKRSSPAVRFAEAFGDLLTRDIQNQFVISEKKGIRTISLTLAKDQFPELYQAALGFIVTANNSSGTYNSQEISRTETEYIMLQTEIDSASKTKTTTKYRVPYTKEYYGNGTDEWSQMDGPWEELEVTRTPLEQSDYKSVTEEPFENAYFDYCDLQLSVDSNGNPISFSLYGRVGLETVFGNETTFEMNLNGTVSEVGTCEPNPFPGMKDLFTQDWFSSQDPDGMSYGYVFALDASGSVIDGTVEPVQHYKGYELPSMSQMIDNWEYRSINGHPAQLWFIAADGQSVLAEELLTLDPTDAAVTQFYLIYGTYPTREFLDEILLQFVG